jgi:DNA repair exonuclease SbcCD nuclease subunit
MKQVTFIHTSDIHLDMPFSSLGNEEIATQRRQELLDALFSILDVAKLQNVNLLFISGDLFEHDYVKKSTILSIKNKFSELYKTEIIICPGNHDKPVENSYYKSTSWSKNVHIVEDVHTPLFFDELNCCIYSMGVSHSVQNDLSFLSQQKLDNSKFNLLAFHGTVDLPFAEHNYNSISSDCLFSLGMDYIALGHMHNFSHMQRDGMNIINPGSPEPLGFDEEGQHGYIQGRLYISDDKQKCCEWSYINSAKRCYHNVDINITGCGSDYEVQDKINKSLQPQSGHLYCLTINGFIPKDYNIDIKKLEQRLKTDYYFLKLKNETQEQYDFREYLEDPGIKGEFVRILLDKLESEANQDKRETILLAMQFGLSAIEKGRIE